MSQRRSFRGGIALPRKTRESQFHSYTADAPEYVRIVLRTYCQTPCHATVKVGDRVLRGQCIGLPEAPVGLPCYSSVSGYVEEIEQKNDANGMPMEILHIKNDMQYEMSREISPYQGKLQDSTRDLLLDHIQKSGIVDDGEPLYCRMLGVPSTADTLLLSCLGDSAYGNYALQLMRHSPDRLLNGAKIVMKTLSLPQAVICVGDTDYRAINALAEAIGQNGMFSLQIVKDKYPAHRMSCLAQALCELPPASAEAHARGKYFCISATACDALFEAFIYGTPVMEKHVYVGGEGVQRSGFVRCAVGTPFFTLLQCMGAKEDVFLCRNGAMNGEACSFDDTVTCDTASLTVQKKAYTSENDIMDCMRCGRCAEVCPVGILPFSLARAISRGDLPVIEKKALSLCMLCGSCVYACPAQIALSRYFAFGKQTAVQQED